jgi:hypothetical protein
MGNRACITHFSTQSEGAGGKHALRIANAESDQVLAARHTIDLPALQLRGSRAN